MLMCPILMDHCAVPTFIKAEPEVAFSYPDDFGPTALDEEALSELPRYCFPYQANSTAVLEAQSFAFLWHGAALFGFCIQAEPETRSSDIESICLVTKLGWHDVFHRLIRQIDIIWKLGPKHRPKIRTFLDSLLVPRQKEERSYKVPYPIEFGIAPFLIDRLVYPHHALQLHHAVPH